MASKLAYYLLCSAALIFQDSESTINFVKYNPVTEMCCNGATFKKQATDQRCCGTSSYSADDQKCCNNALYPVPAEQNTDDNHWQCCYKTTGNGSQVTVYNAKTRQCCNGTVLVKPEPTMYNCCNGVLYSSTTHMCCDLKLVELQSGLDCCGNVEIYNTSAQVCCATTDDLTYKVFDKEDRRQCCGTNLYDVSTSYCCNGNISPLPENMLNMERHDENCCGDEIKPVSKGPLQCHKDHWVELNSTDNFFCGDQQVNFKVDTCCGNQTLALNSGLSCCWSMGVPYDPKTQMCCGAMIEPLSEEDKQRGAMSCCVAQG